MAADAEDNVAQEQPDATRKKRIIIIASAAGALLLVVIVALFLLFFIGDDDTQRSGSADNEAIADNLGEAFYVAMPRDLIFNVPGGRRDRVAQIGVQLLVRGPRNEALAQENIPLLEATLLDVFSRATAERLNTPEGKRELRLQALDAIRIAMQDATDGSSVVEEVLFTGFVLQ